MKLLKIATNPWNWTERLNRSVKDTSPIEKDSSNSNNSAKSYQRYNRISLSRDHFSPETVSVLGWALLTKVDDINLGYGWLFVVLCQGLGDGFGWSLASKMKKGQPNNQIAIYQNYSSKAEKLTTPNFVEIEIFLYKSRSLNMNLKELHQYHPQKKFLFSNPSSILTKLKI